MDGNVKQLFKVWHYVYQKSYTLDTEEAKIRYTTFKKNLANIKETNSMNLPYKLGLNQFSDLSSEEFSKEYLRTVIPEDPSQNLLTDDEDEDLTKRFLKIENVTINWTNFYSPPRNQGACGSCWTFGAAGSIEGNMGIKKNKTFPYLSTQQILDCNPSNSGCNGGSDTNSLNWLVKTGIMYDKEYPYTAKKEACKFNKSASLVKITGVKYCSGSKDKKCTKEVFLGLLSQGPLAVATDGLGDFQSYRSGIYTGLCKQLNHAVVAVGYGYDTNTKLNYFLIRNSWGTGWGEKGYIRIAENPSNNNSCFIVSRGHLPIV